MEFAKVYESKMERVGMVSSTYFGLKRVSFTNTEFGSDDDCMFKTTLKILCSFFSKKSEIGDFSKEKSVLEDLHQEILIKILCGVEHDDLKRLFFVSKAVREAVVSNVFNNGVETPSAPKRLRIPRFRLTAKKLATISVDLFAGDGEEDLAKGALFTETK